MTKTLIGTAVGALALGGLVTAQAMKAPSTDAPRSMVKYESRATGLDGSVGPVLVNCGEGRQALVHPVGLGEQRVSQVDCVDTGALAPAAVDAWGQQAGYRVGSTQFVSAPVSAAPTYRPAVQRTSSARTASAQRSPVYRSEPAQRQPVTQTRSWKKSALIIGGSAAGGAAVGAVLDGKSGAKKGAVVGGVAGTVYDIATRSKMKY